MVLDHSNRNLRRPKPIVCWLCVCSILLEGPHPQPGLSDSGWYLVTAPARQNQVIFPHLAPKHRSGQAENAVSHQAKPFVHFLALLREHNPDCFVLDQGFIAHQLSETPWGLTLMPSLLFPYVTLSYMTLGSYKYLPSRIRTPLQEDQCFSRGLEAEAGVFALTFSSQKLGQIVYQF